MLSLGAHAAPSKQDLKHTFWGVGGLVIVFLIIYYLGTWLKIDLLWQFTKLLTYPVGLAASFLMYGIVFAVIAVIVMFLIGIFVGVFKPNRGTLRWTQGETVDKSTVSVYPKKNRKSSPLEI